MRRSGLTHFDPLGPVVAVGAAQHSTARHGWQQLLLTLKFLSQGMVLTDVVTVVRLSELLTRRRVGFFLGEGGGPRDTGGHRGR